MPSITGHAAIAVVPHDTTVSPPIPCDYLYVGVAGDITLIPYGGTTGILFKDVPIGILPIKTKHVLATGTASSGARAIVAIFNNAD